MNPDEVSTVRAEAFLDVMAALFATDISAYSKVEFAEIVLTAAGYDTKEG